MLERLYRSILEISGENYIDEPLIVGGVPRSMQMGYDNFKDIDITTNTPDITRLAITFASKNNLPFKMFEDTHITVFVDKNNFDFSSHFISSRVVDHLRTESPNIDEKLLEVYSRDFTVNTLHKKFLEDTVIDPTNKGIEDINNRVIQTPVPPEITLEDDFRRVFRAINFASRFGFEIHEDIINYVLSNKQKITLENKWVLKDAFLTSIIAEAISASADMTFMNLEKMKLLSTIPLVGIFKEEVIKRKLVNKYLDEAISLTTYELNNFDI